MCGLPDDYVPTGIWMMSRSLESTLSLAFRQHSSQKYGVGGSCPALESTCGISFQWPEPAPAGRPPVPNLDESLFFSVISAVFGHRIFSVPCSLHPEPKGNTVQSRQHRNGAAVLSSVPCFRLTYSPTAGLVVPWSDRRATAPARRN